MPRLLRDAATVHYGKSPIEVLSEDGEVPVIGTGGVYDRAARQLFSGPAVVVPRKGSLGNPQYVDGPFWPADTTYAVAPHSEVDARWLYYHLDHFDLTRLNEATGVPSISRDWLYRVPLGDDGYPEQQRIAEILSTVDDAIDQTEALIAKTQQIKAGLMHDLFTRGVTPDGQLRPPREAAPQLYKESPLGWIPKEWQYGPLSKAADLDVGYAFKSEWFKSEGIGLLRGENVGYGRADWKDRQCLSPARARQFAEYWLKPGDVVIGMDRTFTKSGVKITPLTEDDCPALLVQRVGRFRPRDCEPAFLRWLIEMPEYLRALNVNQKGMDIPHLSKSEILEPAVPLVSRPEQLSISSRIDAVQAQTRRDELAVAKLSALKSGLMHDLLTGRVAVGPAAVANV